MADFIEQAIKTYSGLSSETKPTIAAGNKIPNGSRWREVDTEKIWFFNQSDDTWYLSGPRIDQSTHAIETIDYSHHEIHSGNHFKAGYQKSAMSADDVIYLCFTTPDTTKWAHWTLTAQSTGAATIELYEGPTLSAEGTSVTVWNRNRNSSNTSSVTAKHTPTVTAPGTKFSTKFIGGEAFKSVIGGEQRGSSEIVLKQDEQYLIKLTANADSIICAIGGDWYEHTDKA